MYQLFVQIIEKNLRRNCININFFHICKWYEIICMYISVYFLSHFHYDKHLPGISTSSQSFISLVSYCIDVVSGASSPMTPPKMYLAKALNILDLCNYQVNCYCLLITVKREEIVGHFSLLVSYRDKKKFANFSYI